MKIIIGRDNVLYEAKVLLMAFADGKDIAPDKKALIKDIDATAFVDLFSRVLKLCVDDVRELLSVYDSETLPVQDQLENSLDESTSFEIDFNVPANMPRSAVESLVTYIHHYAVNSVVGQWLLFQGINSAFILDADGYRKKIRSNLLKRNKPIQRRFSPI